MAAQAPLSNLGLRWCGPRKAFGISRRGPFEECGPVFEKVGELAGKAGLFQRGGSMVHLVFEMEEGQAPFAAPAVVVDDHEMETPEGLEAFDIPGGLFAHAVISGAYSQLPDAWKSLHNDWAPAQGLKPMKLEPKFPSYELYANDPSKTDEADLQTELFMRVESGDAGAVVASRDIPGVTPGDIYAMWADDEVRKELACPGSTVVENGAFEVGAITRSEFKNEKGEVTAVFVERNLALVKGRRWVFCVELFESNGDLHMAGINSFELYPSATGTLMVCHESTTCYNGKADIPGHAKFFENMFDDQVRILKRRAEEGK